ncbi:MAG: homoserine O-succinyltransferase MetX [Pseudomonadales bacterium]
MPSQLPPDSVGLVTPQTKRFDQPLLLACGRSLPMFELVYETYGRLNAERSNAILVCHALSGSHHAAGYHSNEDSRPGWWETCIGPGKPIDTDHFFVLSLNNIGGCDGSTGPASINPETGSTYGADFPPLRVRDWVKTQAMLADELGIEQFAAIAGGSLGGMQAMRWALEYPSRLRHCITIASAMKLTAQNIAFNETARRAIVSDPNFHNGHYLREGSLPKQGLAIARMIGHITYLSDEAMGNKFGRELRSGSFAQGTDNAIEFQVESYLRHQGDVFSDKFDANTYLLMARALDYFDLAREYDDDPVQAFSHAQCQFLTMAFTSDWRFSPERSREITSALIAANKAVSYAEIVAHEGHDAFLLPIRRYLEVFNAYMSRLKREIGVLV